MLVAEPFIWHADFEPCSGTQGHSQVRTWQEVLPTMCYMVGFVVMGGISSK